MGAAPKPEALSFLFIRITPEGPDNLWSIRQQKQINEAGDRVLALLSRLARISRQPAFQLRVLGAPGDRSLMTALGRRIFLRPDKAGMMVFDKEEFERSRGTTGQTLTEALVAHHTGDQDRRPVLVTGGKGDIKSLLAMRFKDRPPLGGNFDPGALWRIAGIPLADSPKFDLTLLVPGLPPALTPHSG